MHIFKKGVEFLDVIFFLRSDLKFHPVFTTVFAQGFEIICEKQLWNKKITEIY